MKCRYLFIISCVLFSFSAFGGIELLGVKQIDEPLQTTVRLSVAGVKTNVQTTLELKYPGQLATIMVGQEQKKVFSNAKSSIVAFNLRSGTKMNDSVALVLTARGQLVYFPDFGHSVGELLQPFRTGVDEAFLKVVNVEGETIEVRYQEPYADNVNFAVRIRVLPDGNLRVQPDDFHE